MESFIYHIAHKPTWVAAKGKGQYEHLSLTSEGFIHCACLDQVVDVANLLFLGQEDLILLKIDVDLLLSKLRYDQLDGTEEKFPHVYGPINVNAVVATFDFFPHADGCFALPEFIDL